MMSKSKSLPFFPCFSSTKSGLWSSDSSATLTKIVTLGVDDDDLIIMLGV